MTIVIKSYQEVLDYLAETPYSLVYFSSPTCPVCGEDLLVIEKLAEQLEYPLYHIQLEKVREASGQMMVLSAPTILIFHGEREYHRQGGFIDFLELEKRMTELKDGVESADTQDTEIN